MNIRRVLFAVCAMPFLSGVGLAGNVASDDELPSVCYGDAASGRLERGRRLPYSGENYRAYSMVGFALGRTYVHSTVRDIMRDAFEGKVSQLPISSFNLFGYAIQFDRNGRSGSNAIDFEAMALHLLALERAARAHGIGIRRVIFDVNLQPKLAATGAGGQVMKRLAFNKQQAWVRHDEHYHVDFRVPCR